MAEFNGGLPVLGQQKVRAGVGQPIALIRDLDEAGTFEPESTQLVNGVVMGVTGRSNMVTAQDLVDMLADELMPRIKTMFENYLVSRD